MMRRFSFSGCAYEGIRVFCSVAALALAAGLVATYAMAASPNPNAATPAPSGTVYKTEVINNDHWLTVCRYSDPALKRRACSTSVRVAGQNTNRLLLVLSVFPAGAHKLQGVLVVPSGIMITPGAALTMDGGAETKLPFTACEPADCVAALPVDQAMVNQLRKATNGAVHFTLQNGQVQTVRFPMNGFAQALPYL
jgi:invasion protein IalB